MTRSVEDTVAQTRNAFHEAVDRLPAYLGALLGGPAMPRSVHPTIPARPGVYLFEEHDYPVYVGQTRNLRQRLRQHTIPSSTHFSASFAYLIAVAAARDSGVLREGTRSERERHPEFEQVFTAAKRRVAEMPVRFIEMSDPIDRTLFEVYATITLKTERFNSFETH